MSNRIVLLDNWGDELFSGMSLSSFPPAATPTSSSSVIAVEGDEDEEEPIPPTLRSSVFVRYETEEETLHVTEYEPESEPQTVRESSRVIAAVARISEVDFKELHGIGSSSDAVAGNDDHRAA